MDYPRRQVLKGGTLALLGSGFLSRFDKVASAQGSTATLTGTLKAQAGGPSEKLLLGPQPNEEGPPEPAVTDRLPLEWNKKTVARFKEQSVAALSSKVRTPSRNFSSVTC